MPKVEQIDSNRATQFEEAVLLQDHAIRRHTMTDNNDNTGHRNTGNWNTGNWNTGDLNTGNRNTGNWNTGNRNTGHRNTGNLNTGNWNTGNLNTGNWNTGDLNTGYRNTGNLNTGNWNTGDLNTGNLNTGNWNTGDLNTGNWNTGDRNTGYFNTITPTDVVVFDRRITNREAFLEACPAWLYHPSLTTWVADSEMSDQEKIDNPTFHTCGGYLRANDWTAEWAKAFADAGADEVQKVRDLPGFDAAVFKEITGLDLSLPAKDQAPQSIIVDGVEYVRADLRG